MWFKNIKLFRLSPDFEMNADDIGSRLEKQGYRPICSNEMQTMGWTEPRAGYGLVYAQNGQYLLCLRTEKKLLPASVINHVAKARASDIEERQGFKPGRKQMKEIKEMITDELLPKAFSTYTDTRVWIDARNGWLVIDSASHHKCDEVLGMLAKAIEPFPVSPLYIQSSPSMAMTVWLSDDEAPSHFTIDQDTELRSTSESRSTVRYLRHSIDVADVHKHVQAGRQCTRLALTWADRVSFVLTDGLEIKRVNPLDILTEKQDTTAHNDDERFESDFALMTGELAKLFNDLVEALGGEKDV